MRRKEGVEGRLTREAVGEAETDTLVVTIVKVIEARKTMLAKRMTTASKEQTCCAAGS